MPIPNSQKKRAEKNFLAITILAVGHAVSLFKGIYGRMTHSQDAHLLSKLCPFEIIQINILETLIVRGR